MTTDLLKETRGRETGVSRRGYLEQFNVAWESVWVKYGVLALKQMSAFLVTSMKCHGGYIFCYVCLSVYNITQERLDGLVSYLVCWWSVMKARSE